MRPHLFLHPGAEGAARPVDHPLPRRAAPAGADRRPSRSLTLACLTLALGLAGSGARAEQAASLFELVKSVQVTPAGNYVGGGFARIHYLAEKDRLVLTFNATVSRADASCDELRRYAYKEFTADLVETGDGVIYCHPLADTGSVLVSDDLYVACQARQGETVGWQLLRYDAVTWAQKSSSFFALTDYPKSKEGDPMLACVNGQIDVSSQYDDNPTGTPPPLAAGTATHHQLFTTDLQFVGERVLSDTPHVNMDGMVSVDGVTYLLASNAYLGDLVVMAYDSSWRYIGASTLKANAHAPEGAVFDGSRFYVAYVDTSQRTDGGLPIYQNIRLAAFDSNWNLLEDIAVTSYTPKDNKQPDRPYLALRGRNLYLSFDQDTLDAATHQEQLKSQAFLKVYELPASSTACTSFTISPTSASASASAGSQSVTVTGSPAGCSGGSWATSTTDSWLSLSSASGTGSGSVTVSWSSNSASSSRAGTATIAGSSFTVTQAGGGGSGLTLVGTTAVTPTADFLGGDFVRIFHRGTKVLVTFSASLSSALIPGACPKKEPQEGAYVYREFNEDMTPTGRQGIISCGAKGDNGGLLVGDRFYLALSGIDDPVLDGWALSMYDSTSFTTLPSAPAAPLVGPVTHKLDCGRGAGDPMLAYVNGLIDIDGQYGGSGCCGSSQPPYCEPGPTKSFTTHHNFFDPVTFTAASSPASLTLPVPPNPGHIGLNSMIVEGDTINFLASTSLLGDLVLMRVDSAWTYLSSSVLRSHAWCPEGVATYGGRYYVSFLDSTICSGTWGCEMNARLAVFDQAWRPVEEVALTSFTKGSKMEAQKPTILLVGDKLYVAYLTGPQGAVGATQVSVALFQLSASSSTCSSFTIAPTSASPTASAGSQSVTVTGSPSGCAGGSWTASGNGSWLTVSPSGGTGSGSVTVSWTENTASSSRIGTATIAGSSFTVTQAGTDSQPGETILFVPIVLDAYGAAGSHYASELTLTNRGTADADVRLTYTGASSLGGGGGTAHVSIGAGRQVIVPDAIAYLKGLGVSIPDSGTRGGTLTVGFSGLAFPSDGLASVRTTTAVAKGRAGLSYAGVPASRLLSGRAYVCGLRENVTDRSNVALQNAGTPADGNVTLRLTVHSGDGSASAPLPDQTLAPGGFVQINGVLGQVGKDDGWVEIERIAGTAPYDAYSVVNDNLSSDGSFFAAQPQSTDSVSGLTVPVALETGSYESELVLTNWSADQKALSLAFVADAVTTSDHTARASLSLAPGSQLIIPGLVQYLRDRQTLGVGARGTAYVGTLVITATSGDCQGLAVGVRTSTPSPTGRFGLFYPAVPFGAASSSKAWLVGLQQDGSNRTNLAIVNTGEAGTEDDSFEIDLYDGADGKLVTTVKGIARAAQGWGQIDTILSRYAPGATQGYACVRRTSGSNPFIAYAVINDGAQPGQRSDDGAYLASSD